MLLTGASRGIGHATVKRFQAAGWRVITGSRHAFPEDCPWEAGPDDHLQVDLSDRLWRAERLNTATGLVVDAADVSSGDRRALPPADYDDIALRLRRQ